MALMPCSACSQRFRGEADRVYVQRYEGDQVESYCLLLCRPCAEERMKFVRAFGLYRDEEGEWCMTDGDDSPKMHSARRGRSSGRR